MTQHMTSTPIADALIRLRNKRLVSFHALPLSAGNSIQHSSLYGKYMELFGENLLDSELTYTAPVFDSFFSPKGEIRHAQLLAAKAFGSKQTYFITAGTTVSIQIAVDALVAPGDRVLVDKSCHQSIHFGLVRNRNRITYICPPDPLPRLATAPSGPPRARCTTAGRDGRRRSL